MRLTEIFMPKTIVFCADGTWNGPQDDLRKKADGNAPGYTPCCSPGLTNVCKLFAWLDGSLVPAQTSWGGAEMEKVLTDASGNPTQIARYLHGVGDSQPTLAKLACGFLGVGVVARIARGYTYISRNFEQGDSIVLVGLSRGAYTARALAGLIAGSGVLRPDLVAKDDGARFDTAVAAWFRWRKSFDTRFQRILDDLVEMAEIHGAFPEPRPLDDSCFVPAKVAGVAVWDTVGELGIPMHYKSECVDLFRFCNLRLDPTIDWGLHAVALDEQREPFTPTLWEPRQNVSQRLFPGGHCDVGGGYSDHGLSDGPLQWFVDQLKQKGLKFNANPPVPVDPNPRSPRHREWVKNEMWRLQHKACPNGSSPRGWSLTSPFGSG
ncbi:hypothetical protein CR51_18760 [Caballeronia megalochromosomata]|nr:hypothetical protein CR51_18760 [Caballeronia megalochromosomata]